MCRIYIIDMMPIGVVGMLGLMQEKPESSIAKFKNSIFTKWNIGKK